MGFYEMGDGASGDLLMGPGVAVRKLADTKGQRAYEDQFVVTDNQVCSPNGKIWMS